MSDTRAILVTGASTGIGHATALRLAEAGFTVFAGVRKESDAREKDALHENIRPVLLDVTNAEQIAATFAVIRESGLPLYGLLNNAGIAVGGPIEYLPIDALRRQFEVNVFGTIAVTQAAIPFLRATRGRIVTIGSIAGRFGAPFVGPYGASKAAVAVLMDSARIELAPYGIRTVLFEFAAVKTPIWEKGRALKNELAGSLPAQAIQDYAPFIEAMTRQIEHEERGGLEPSLIADAVLTAFTAPSPRARYVIGRQAKMQAAVALLPHKTRDNMIRKVLGLSS
ncbi:MAG TPA: SDR family oxidoreductase [Candidatus Acidoferrales bacterium]|jgi:NAD(P)-dependent dehydrogenase (short-subunit alcohol dehydrogenase family)|nr:SDR family oxidoreductase [Candidatus Acidoferrales bacterium]